MSKNRKEQKIYSDIDAEMVLHGMEMESLTICMSLTGKYDAQMEKNAQNWICLANEVLESNQTYEVAFKTMMSALYYALALSIFYKRTSKPEVVSETYARKALNCWGGMEEASKVLIYDLLLQDKIYEACKIIAEYNCDFEMKIDESGLPEKIYTYFSTNLDVYITLADKMRNSRENYKKYYQLFEDNPDAYYYAKVLLQYAREMNACNHMVVLYHHLCEWEKKNNVSGIIKFETLCNRMQDLSFIDSYYDMQTMILEADNCFRENKETIYLAQKSIPMFLESYYLNKSNLLILLGEFKECIQFLKKVDAYCVNDLLLENLAYCYYRLSDFEHAKMYCLAALSMDYKESAVKLIAKIYMCEGQYFEASKLLVELIGRLHNQKNQLHIYGETKEGQPYRMLLAGDRNRVLEAPYQLLIQAYVATNQLAKAKAMYMEMQGSIKSYEATIYSGIMLNIDMQLIDREKEVKDAWKELDEEFKKVQSKNEKYESVMNELSTKLIKCQILDDSIEISDDYFEENIAYKMDTIIEAIEKREAKTTSKEYKEILLKIKKQFPNLEIKAQEFFASAEQIYQTFLDNPILDYAPVMVEYCKVVDVSLWSYLDNSKEYKDLVTECLNSGRQKTLGSGAFIVSRNIGKSLEKYEDTLHKIKKLRNNSAHVNVSRKPDVEWIRNILWDNSGLLQMLSR